VLLVIRYGATMRRIGAQWEGIEISEAEQIKEVRLERELLAEEMVMVKGERETAGEAELKCTTTSSLITRSKDCSANGE
jgi:hypothetical protein